MSFADVKAQLRQTVHDQFKVDALFYANAIDDPIGVTVRFHGRGPATAIGDLDNGGYAQVIGTADQLIFMQPETVSLGIVLKHGCKVEIPSYNLALILDTQVPRDGPLELVWNVTR